MSDQFPATQPAQPTQPFRGVEAAPYGAAPPPMSAPMSLQPYGAPLAQYGAPTRLAPGKIRSTGTCILLTVVTFGIYPLVWFYSTHEEMKRHTGQGMGGGLAFVLAFLVGIVMPYVTSSEVGALYERVGLRKPVSGATGLWYFPGMLLVIGPLVWFVKTNEALNAYWHSQGVR